jgi:hypothetical protein
MSGKRPELLRPRISRRRFAQAVTIAAAGAVIAPQAAVAQSESKKPADAPVAPQQPPLTPEEQAQAEARTDAILRKYGSRLTDAQKADVRRQVREGQKSFTDLRAFILQNSDPPATVLNIRPRAPR